MGRIGEFTRVWGNLGENIDAQQLAKHKHRNPDLHWFRASTRKVDRHRSIVEPNGFRLADYNGTFGWMHDVYGRYDGSAPPPENILGAVRDTVISDEFFDIGVEWASHERAVLVEGMVRDKFVNSVSVGFIPVEIGTIEHPDGTGEVLDHYTAQDLVEVSVAIIPSNAEATELAVARCVSAGLPLQVIRNRGAWDEPAFPRATSSGSPAPSADTDLDAIRTRLTRTSLDVTRTRMLAGS